MRQCAHLPLPSRFELDVFVTKGHQARAVEAVIDQLLGLGEGDDERDGGEGWSATGALWSC